MSNLADYSGRAAGDGWTHINKDDGSYAGYSTKIVESSVNTRTPKGSGEKRTYATMQTQVIVTAKDGKKYRLHFETEVDITTNESARQVFDQMKAMKHLAKDMTGSQITKYFAEGAEFKTMNLTDSWDKEGSLQMAWKPANSSRDVAFKMLCKKTDQIYESNAPNESTWSYDLSLLHLKDRSFKKLIEVETKQARREADLQTGQETTLGVAAKGVYRGTLKKVKQSISGALNMVSKLPKIGDAVKESSLMHKAEPKRHEFAAKMADLAFKEYRDSQAIPDVEIERGERVPGPARNEHIVIEDELEEI